MGKHGNGMCDECGILETVEHVCFLSVVNMKNSVGLFLEI